MKMLCNSSLVNAFMALVSLLAASSSGRALRLSRPYMLARQSRGFTHYAVEASPWQQPDCMQYKLPAQSNRDGRFWPIAEARAAGRRVRLRMGTCRGAPMTLASEDE